MSKNGKWKKLKLDDKKEDKDKYINLQTLIRSGAFQCDYDQVKETLLDPVLEEKRNGEAWYYESDILTMIFGVRYLEAEEEWLINTTMSYPFNAEVFQETCELMADKILDFMEKKKITKIWGSRLLIYKYADSQYAQAGYSVEQFLSFIQGIYASKGLLLTMNDEMKRIEINLEEEK